MSEKQNLVFLEYTFLFDAESAFGHLFEFEKILFDFFDAHNLQVEAIRSVEGAQGRRLVYISKKPPTSQLAEPVPTKSVSLKEKVKTYNRVAQFSKYVQPKRSTG